MLIENRFRLDWFGTLVSLALLLQANAACSDTASVPNSVLAPPALPISLSVSVNNRGTDANAATLPKNEDQFQLTIIEQQGQPLFIASREGRVSFARAIPSGAGWRALEALDVWNSNCQYVSSSTYDEFAIEIRGAAVAGTALGSIRVGGDALSSVGVAGSITGSVNTDVPRLIVENGASKLHPIDQIAVLASSPLDPATQLTAVAGDGTTVTLEAQKATPANPSHMAVARFVTTRPLLPDTSYNLKIAAGGHDLLGQTAMLPVEFSTLPLPIRLEDGFEASDEGVISGYGIVGRDVLPPLNGERSLYLGPSSAGGRFTTRLAVHPGDRVIRAAYRHVGLSQDDRDPSGFLIAQVMAPGEPATSFALPRPASLTRDDVSGFWLGETTTIEIPLPSGASEQVIFDLGRGPNCAYNPFTFPGFQVDDLRVE